jgi:hypothetical protein
VTLPDTDDIDTLGGVKVNLAPVEDPTTDLDADEDNIQRCDVAMMTHTAIKAWARFTASNATGTMVLVAHDAQWGNGSGVTPTLARSGVGVFTVTFPATVSDELDETHTLNFRAAWGTSRGGATKYFIDVVPTAANVLTARVFDSTVVADDGAGVDFDVFGF